ncbi:MAG: hypothetical protein Q4D07_00610 [Selenomonadaceae bacterium]|nr:hypothetical protein [Selenomonadaceae bacterium]
MPRNMMMFILAWLMIAAVGAYVVFDTPAAERDWYGYSCAMLLMPFIFLLMGLVLALFKILFLIPYLFIRTLADQNAVYRWCQWNSNWYSTLKTLMSTSFSCFYIPSQEELDRAKESK